MKRNSVKDQKKDNISSRLLGQNVSEINIEKFRDSKEQVSQYNIRGRLNEEILKTISNKFSCEVIFNLNLSNQQLTNIDALEKCTSLVMLNIKNNQIKDLFALRSCPLLVYLDMQNNSVKSLETLKNCEKLANLHAEGNQISNADGLRGLYLCKNLRTVYFKTLSGSDQNPICQTQNYKKEVYDSIPSLRRLDGIPKDYELDNGEDLVKEQKEIDFKLDANQPWYAFSFNKDVVSKDLKINGEEELKLNIKTSKSKISTLEAKLKALMLEN